MIQYDLVSDSSVTPAMKVRFRYGEKTNVAHHCIPETANEIGEFSKNGVLHFLLGMYLDMLNLHQIECL